MRSSRDVTERKLLFEAVHVERRGLRLLLELEQRELLLSL
jgi:hypothetical protein